MGNPSSLRDPVPVKNLFHVEISRPAVCRDANQDDPHVWMRRLTHRRSALVSDRTRLKNRLHSILRYTLVPLLECDLFSKKRDWLRQVPLAQGGRWLIRAIYAATHPKLVP